MNIKGQETIKERGRLPHPTYSTITIYYQLTTMTRGRRSPCTDDKFEAEWPNTGKWAVALCWVASAWTTTPEMMRYFIRVLALAWLTRRDKVPMSICRGLRASCHRSLSSCLPCVMIRHNDPGLLSRTEHRHHPQLLVCRVFSWWVRLWWYNWWQSLRCLSRARLIVVWCQLLKCLFRLLFDVIRRLTCRCWFSIRNRA